MTPCDVKSPDLYMYVYIPVYLFISHTVLISLYFPHSTYFFPDFVTRVVRSHKKMTCIVFDNGIVTRLTRRHILAPRTYVHRSHRSHYTPTIKPTEESK